jgi:antitoxin (DNA-binding transcriptional repressor) of toxin-antitoxin stability system
MVKRISATRAARVFSDILNRVRYRGESFIVERGGVPVCTISPAHGTHRTVTELVRLLKTIPKPDNGYLRIVEGLARHQPPAPKRTWPR